MGKWSCLKCTYENEQYDQFCIICETNRPEDSNATCNFLDGLLGQSSSAATVAPDKSKTNIINLALDDDKINFINLRVLTDARVTPVELMVDASLPLETITARCLEACDCWNVCTAAIDMLSDLDTDTWVRVNRQEDLVASTSPRTVKIIVQKYHVFDNVHVDSIGQRVPTSHALTEYTEHTRKALSGSFPDYRRIRGDGKFIPHSSCTHEVNATPGLMRHPLHSHYRHLTKSAPSILHCTFT
jgi:hypothetical protein